MEKKNTILLTVIAIATLLVAVVGATFAYFTAQVTTTNDANATTTVKTYALTKAVMDMGASASSTGVYPGAVIVKPLTVTGTCPTGSTTCEDVNATIKVTPTVPAEFGTGENSTVTWKLVSSTTPITCTNANNTETGQYSTTATCNDDAITAATEILSGNTTELTKDIVVKGSEAGVVTNYYLIVSYENKGSAQNDEQGQEFSVKMDFVEKQ